MSKSKKEISELSIDDIYYVADKYIANKNSLYRHNYNSFEQFIDSYIPEYLYQSNNIFNTQITDKFKYVNYLKFSDYKVQLPCDDFTNKIIYPSEARLRMLNYTIKVSFHVEQFQDVLDLITEKRIQGLEFDRTISATIINADNSKDGEYTVNDGSSSFLAYSENTNYKVDEQVYVTIPNNNFNEQK